VLPSSDRVEAPACCGTLSLQPCFGEEPRVATDDEVIQFHRHHRDPEIHSVTLGRFFAQTVSAEDAQGHRARG